jgi:hypothetical protein
MAKRGYKRCRICGRHESEAGPISSRGLCKRDAKERENANLDALLDANDELALHHARRLYMGARQRLMKVERLVKVEGS